MNFDTLYEMAMSPEQTAEAIKQIQEGVNKLKDESNQKDNTIAENNRMIGELNRRLFLLQTGKVEEPQAEPTPADIIKERYTDYFKGD